MHRVHITNNDQQHRERIALVRYYSETRGHPVDYSEVVHELLHEKFLSLGLKLPTD